MEEVSNSVVGVVVHGVVSSKLKLRPVLQASASFCDVVQGVYAPLSSYFLVQEAPYLVIPMGQDVE
jgi:hypothetical protein